MPKTDNLMDLSVSEFLRNLNDALSGKAIPEEYSSQLVEHNFIKYLSKEDIEKHKENVARSGVLFGDLWTAYGTIDKICQNSGIQPLEAKINETLGARQKDFLVEWQKKFEGNYSDAGTVFGNIASFDDLYRTMLSQGLSFSSTYRFPSLATDISRKNGMRNHESLYLCLKHVFENSYNVLVGNNPAFLNKYDDEVNDLRLTFRIRWSRSYNNVKPIVDAFREKVKAVEESISQVMSAQSDKISEFGNLIDDIRLYDNRWNIGEKTVDGRLVKALENEKRLNQYLKDNPLEDYNLPIGSVITKATKNKQLYLI